jgi:hypothetical protein
VSQSPTRREQTKGSGHIPSTIEARLGTRGSLGRRSAQPRNLGALDGWRSLQSAFASMWRILDSEVKEHEAVLGELTRQAAPQLDDAFGIGVDTAAEVLIIAGDNPERVRTEAAWAKLCSRGSASGFFGGNQPALTQPWWASPGQRRPVPHVHQPRAVRHRRGRFRYGRTCGFVSPASREPGAYAAAIDYGELSPATPGRSTFDRVGCERFGESRPPIPLVTLR